ncbi:Flp pilus assembly protein CpaB [Arthrobacter sp. HLT1-21]
MAPGTAPQRQAWAHHFIRRFVFRNRRLLAALLLCLAAALTVEALIPPEQTRVTVVAAAADLPVGTVLTAGDLATLNLPPEAVPSTSFADPGAVVGEQLAVPLLRDTVLAPTFFVGSGLLTGAPAGTVAVPVRPADQSTVQLLSPGQYVDVVLSSGNGFEVPATATVIARGLPVLWTSTSVKARAPEPWPGDANGEGLVVLAADPTHAATLAGSSSNGQVHLVLTGPPPESVLP